jgi:hypothetical protein
VSLKFAGRVFLEMWTKPRKTIEKLMDINNRYGFVSLCFFYGFVQAIHFSQILSLSAGFDLWKILLLVLVFAIPLGAAYFYVSAFIFYWIGKFIGGKGSFLDIRCAISWSNVTQVVITALIVMMLAVFQNDFFSKQFVDQTFENWPLVFVIIFLVGEVVLSIWTFIIFVGAIAAAHRFSIWMSLLNLVLVIALYLCLVFVIGKLMTFMGGDAMAFLGGRL